MSERNSIRLFTILCFTIFSIFMYFGQLSSTEMHEIVHKEIYQDYNISSNYTVIKNPITWVKTGLLGYTEAINTSEYYTKCNETCILSHNLNEIYTYNSSIFTSYFVIFMIFFIFFIILIYFEFREVNIHLWRLRNGT